MKKRSQWIYILSVLLCLTMLFASCNKDPDDTDTNTDTDTVITTEETTEEVTELTETEPAIPEDEKVDYASKIAGWIKYFKKAEDKTELKSSLERLFNVNYDDESRRVSTTSNYIIVTDTSRQEYYDINGYEQMIVRRSYTVYNMNTGEEISFADDRYDTGVAPNADKYYIISELNGDSGILTVKCYTLDNTPVQMPDGTSAPPAERVHVPTYSYYDANLDVIASDLEEAVNIDNCYMHSGYFTVEMDGKYHIYEDGVKFYEYEVTRGVIIPDVSFSLGENKYICTINGSQLESVLVMNSDYRAVIEYHVSSVYDDVEWYVLGNGNILIQGLTDMDDDRAEYDIELGQRGTKINVDHVLIDVKSATVTEIELGYVIDRMVNNLSYNESFELKEEFATFQYAEIYKTGDKGTYIWSETNKIISVVLDDDLTIKQELESVVKDQSYFKGFNEDGKLLFDANSDVYYADPENNTVGLYVDTAASEYTKVNGGFIYKGKLYNNDCQEIYDLVDVDRYYKVKNGVVYVYTKKAPTQSADSYEQDQISSSVSFAECAIVDGKAVLIGNWQYDPNNDIFSKMESFTFIYRGSDSADGYLCVEIYNASGELVKTCSSVRSLRATDDCRVLVLTVDADTEWSHYEYCIIK